MKPSKVIIAAILIILTANMLSGCGGSADASERQQGINEMREIKKTASLRLEQEVSGGQMTVTVFIDNPERKPISSTQAWISFNPDHMQGVKVDTSESPFDMPPPYDNGFDEAQGLVRLGGATNKPSTDAVIQVGQVVFGLNTMLDAYDYRYDLSGHVSANTILNGTPYNILQRPDSPLIVINQ